MPDAKSLIEKIRRSRESGVEVEGRVFKFTRPTAADAPAMSDMNNVQIAQRFVTGWDLTELELIPGGGPEPVPFDSALFAVWIEDRPEYWAGLARAIIDAFVAHRNQQKESEKN